MLRNDKLLQIKENVNKLPAMSAVYCKTREQAEILVKALDRNGLLKHFALYWDEYKWNTCYEIKNGIITSYGNLAFFKEDHYSIIEFDELSEKKEANNSFQNSDWDLARKIMADEYNGGFSDKELEDIFGNYSRLEILLYLSAEEVSDKISNYEKNNSIKIGDRVASYVEDDMVGIVMDEISDSEVYVFTDNGCIEKWEKAKLKVTGKKVDLSQLFETEEENER